MHYIVTYDISKDAEQGEEYKRITAALETMGGQRVQGSVFILNDSRTAEQIATSLAAEIKNKENNRLFVSEINENTSYRFPLNEDEMTLFFGNAIEKLPKIAGMNQYPLGKK